MPLYYFHICNGSGFVEDFEGQSLADDEAAREQAIKSARDLMAGDIRDGSVNLSSFIEVEDSERHLLFTLTFEDAVNLERTATPPGRQRLARPV